MPPSDNDRRIDNIEFAVKDIARSRAFYGEAFGWSFKDYGPDYCGFTDDRLTGGFAKSDSPKPGGVERLCRGRQAQIRISIV